MGRWSYLKAQYPKPPADAEFQQKVDHIKTVFSGRTIKELTDAFDELEEAKDDLKTQITDLNIIIAAHEQALVDRLDAFGETSVKFEGAGSISLSDKPYFKVLDPDAFRKWIDETQPEVLQVYAQTRDGICKAHLEKRAPLPPGLELAHIETTISRRKG